MKKFLILIAGAMLSSASFAVIGFDDIADGEIADGYAGLNWENMFVLTPGSSSTYAGSGYENGMLSPRKVAYNAYGDDACALKSVDPFNMYSAYFTAAWQDGLTLVIEAYLANNSVDIIQVELDHDAPTFVEMNFVGVDKVRFSTIGGTEVPGLDGDGKHFAMDNLDLVGAVPEPFTMALAGLSLAAAARMRRRK